MAYTTQPRTVSVSGRSRVAVAAAALSPCTRSHAAASAADESVTRGPSQRSASAPPPRSASGSWARYIPISYNARMDYLFAALIFLFIVAVLVVLWKREHPKKD
jgi:hypothetical protein